MGSSDSKDDKEEEKKMRIPADPLINRLRKTFRLQLNSTEQTFTHSFLHTNFSQQIIKNKTGKVDQDFSPFCCITLPDPAEHILRVITCVLISPIMALAPSQHLCSEDGFFFRKNLVLNGLCKGSKITITVKDVSSLPNVNLVLLMLEKPSWQLGWCGLSILEDSSQIKDLPIFCIKNAFTTGQSTIKDSEKPVIKQIIEKVYYEDMGNFKGKGSREGQNLLVQILERKPYAIGVQKGSQSIFFNEDILKDLQRRSKQYLTPATESQILKEIDLQQMQIESSW